MKKQFSTVVVVILLMLTGIIGISAEDQYIEPNPELPNSCGIDMVLVIDSSGSIDNIELIQMKDAYEVFIDEFLPATPTLIGVVDFGTNASVIQGFTNNVTVLNASVNAPTSGGYTNWQDALLKAHGMFDPRNDKPDLIIFASDGDPNRKGSPPEEVNETEAVKAAVTEANSIKADGIRIIALGIGDNIKTENLEAISSHDAVITSNFSSFAEDLAVLAADLCGRTITVKKIINETGVPGWEFSVDVHNGNSTPQSGLTDSEGFINFEIEFNESNTTVDVAETVQEGYFVDQAVCKIGEVTVGTFDGEESIDNITMDKNDIVSCEFVNVPASFCGNGEVNEGETCDEGENNTDTPCNVTYGSNCSYCDTSCQEQTIEGPFCGDGVKNGPEECDGIDGTGPHQSCTEECTLTNVTYCGDGIKQTPNDEGTGGPGNDGYEECDGSSGVGENQICTSECRLETTADGCTLTQGYWKNHDWPDSHDKDDEFFDSGMTWFEILKTPPKGGDAYIILAHQYIAYVLNQANGASLPGDPVAEAEDYFSTYNPGEVPKGDRQNLIDLAGFLDDYNNGLMGISHCDN
jgi:uncharacterized protein YegL